MKHGHRKVPVPASTTTTKQSAIRKGKSSNGGSWGGGVEGEKMACQKERRGDSDMVL